MSTAPSTPARRRTRVLVGALAGVSLALGAPLAASAHIHVTPDSSAAATSTTLTFSFSHGCEDFPTTAVIIDIPEGVEGVVPVAQAGWSIERTLAANGTVTRVAYTADSPVEGGIKGQVSLDARFSAALADSSVPFPVTQECTTGSTSWTEVAAEGEDEPESPAPVVAVGAVAEDGGHAHGGTAGDADAAAHEDAAAEADSPHPAATTALWLGAGGLALGAAALLVAVAAWNRRRA